MDPFISDDIESDYIRYMQSDCADYAVALQALVPNLSFGILTDPDDGAPIHVFVHDKKQAYDYSGAHPLPYHGAWASSICNLDKKINDVADTIGYDPDTVNGCLEVIADQDWSGQLEIKDIPWSVI